ncbi:hypothetical protein ACFS5L_18285 [Streptomyces phyllanthi]|uniref:GAF domain-containing protein n=1 Tax=Streptomyces phyllanthi TaxID=1803180 RepID=A0A5N8WD46_9ACTN|nr:hypothetical protein [Streptomyces phyllanthi]MPY45393.1 hypothetical protein [Streptomyces phyllanthi]
MAENVPFRLAFAVAPLRGARDCRGALLLMWPPHRPDQLTLHERRHIAFGARRIARVLDTGAHPAVAQGTQP